MRNYTGSITLTNINDGEDSNSYHVISNIEGFLKYFDRDLSGNEVVSFSDDEIEFTLERNIDTELLAVDPTTYTTTLTVLDDSAFFNTWGDEEELGLWSKIWNKLYIKNGNRFDRNIDSDFHVDVEYYINLLEDITDFWELFKNIEIADIVDGTTISATLYDKVYSINNTNNSIVFNLHNSLFYPIDENLNLEYAEWWYNGGDAAPENWDLIYSTLYVKNGDNYEPAGSNYDKDIIYYVLLPSNYYNALLAYRDYIILQNAYFYLKAYANQLATELYNFKIFYIEYAVNISFARFALTASNILASVDNSTMIFDADGLTIYDAGLKIRQNAYYEKTKDTVRDPSKIYYRYDTNTALYILVAADAPFSTDFYELIPEGDLLKYDIDNKCLSIKGNGEFTGTIYATDGEFSGTITADSGTIGGFIISEDKLESSGVKATLWNNYYAQWDKSYSEETPAEWSEIRSSLYILNENNEYVLNQSATYDSSIPYFVTLPELWNSIYNQLYIRQNGKYILNEDSVYHDNINYYYDVDEDLPLVLLFGTDGRIVAQLINLGTGAKIDDYISLGNAYIYNPSVNDNNFIDIKDGDNNSIINFRADGNGHIGSIFVNGNSSKLNGLNWWISPDKALFSNIDVTGTIHTSVFETGKILSVGGSMIFKESARVSSVQSTTEGVLLILESKMNLQPGSIILCTTSESDYTDPTIDLLTFYGEVISSRLNRDYVLVEDMFPAENLTYYIINPVTEKYTPFTESSFFYETSDNAPQSGKTYYTLENEIYVKFTEQTFSLGVIYYERYEVYELLEDNLLVLVNLESSANSLGLVNLIKLIIQLGDLAFEPTVDKSRYSEWEYNHLEDDPPLWQEIYGNLYLKDNLSEVYTLLLEKPSDWEETYYNYYIKENNNYILVASGSRIGTGKIGEATIIGADTVIPEFMPNIYYSKTPVFDNNVDSEYHSEATYYVNNNKDYYVYDELKDSLVLYTGNELIFGINYYEKDFNYTNNLTIGVNATNHFNKMLYPEGFTFIKFNEIKDNIPIYDNKPILFLGNLDHLLDSNILGYGLYGENVYLTGSLTTNLNASTYAGINTLNGFLATIFQKSEYGFDEPDTSKIVFWGGAEDPSENSILNAPFLVTEKGSLYANHGIFEGSIFIKASIKAGELHTAAIYGTGDKPALKVFDTQKNKGISFCELVEEDEIETLNLTSNGFSISPEKYFVEIKQDIDNNSIYVNFSGNEIIGNHIYTTPNNDLLFHFVGTNINTIVPNENTTKELSFVEYNFSELNSSYKLICNELTYVELNGANGTLKLYSNSVEINKEFTLGDKVKYTLATDDLSNIIGYNMYVH